MREFIAQSMPELDDLIPDSSWTELESAEVEIVPALVLTGHLRGRSVKLDAALHLDKQEMRFYFEHPEQIGRRDEGGALVADAFDLGSADRLNVSLAWIAAWQRAREGDVQLVFPVLKKTPDYVDGETVPDASAASPAPGRAVKKSKPKTRQKEDAPERKLKDIDAMEVSTSRNASTPPQGSLSSERTGTKLDKRRSAKPGESKPRGTGRSAPEYNPMDREVAGLKALSKILERHGVEIEDTTARPVGADAIGTDGRYYELKVHGGKASGGLRIESSEVLQAREMGDEYVLVVVENVEDTSANTRVTLIPNPLSVLAVHPFGRVEVTGYDNDSFEQHELS